jgi:hypothetical protein
MTRRPTGGHHCGSRLRSAGRRLGRVVRSRRRLALRTGVITRRPAAVRLASSENLKIRIFPNGPVRCRSRPAVSARVASRRRAPIALGKMPARYKEVLRG